MSITDELRELAHMFYNVWLDKDGSVTYTTGTSAPSLESVNLEKHIKGIADRIDAEHEQQMAERRRSCVFYDAERNYCNVHDLTIEDYKRGYDDGFASADDWLGQHESDMAEHGWVRRNKEHVISHATVEVTPHIDWSRMADELDEFAKIVRGMASGAE